MFLLNVEKTLFPCLFQLLEATHIPWLMTVICLQSHQWLVETFSWSLTLTLTFLPLSVRTLVVTLSTLNNSE